MSLTCSSPGLRHWEEKLNDVLLPQKPSPESRLACPVYLKSFVDILLGPRTAGGSQDTGSRLLTEDGWLKQMWGLYP